MKGKIEKKETNRQEERGGQQEEIGKGRKIKLDKEEKVNSTGRKRKMHRKKAIIIKEKE